MTFTVINRQENDVKLQGDECAQLDCNAIKNKIQTISVFQTLGGDGRKLDLTLSLRVEQTDHVAQKCWILGVGGPGVNRSIDYWPTSRAQCAALLLEELRCLSAGGWIQEVCSAESCSGSKGTRDDALSWLILQAFSATEKNGNKSTLHVCL